MALPKRRGGESQKTQRLSKFKHYGIATSFSSLFLSFSLLLLFSPRRESKTFRIDIIGADLRISNSMSLEEEEEEEEEGMENKQATHLVYARS